MGLADILSNPGIIGLAMAGMSRDPEAPVRTMGVLQGANEMNRQAAQDEEKKLQRADTLRMTQDMLGGQNQEGQALMNILSRMQGIKQMPQMQTGFTPNNATGAATDLETGQSYDTEVPNQARMAETKQYYADLQKITHPAEAAIDFSKYPNADPAVAISLAANKFSMRKETMKALFDMAQEEQKQGLQHEREKEKIKLKGQEDRLTAQGKPEKPVNMDPNYDAVGTQVLGAEYHTVQGQQKFAELYKNDPAVRKLIDDKIARDAKNKFQGFPPINNFIGTDPNGNLLGWNVRGGGVTASPGPEGGVFPKTRHPLGEKAETALTGALDSIEMLNAIEKNAKSQSIGIPFAGQAIGWAKSKAGNAGAQEFDTNVAQLRVNAQNIIKGIPSNFDVQTFIKTLPGFDKTEKENLARIKLSKKYLANTIKTGLQNYEKSNFNIPDYLKERAAQLLSGAEQPIEAGKGQPAQQGQAPGAQQTQPTGKPKTWNELKKKYQE
jgi:hypothetical protein